MLHFQIMSYMTKLHHTLTTDIAKRKSQGMSLFFAANI